MRRINLHNIIKMNKMCKIILHITKNDNTCSVEVHNKETLQKQLNHKHNRTACHRHLKQTCTKPCC